MPKGKNRFTQWGQLCEAGTWPTSAGLPIIRLPDDGEGAPACEIYCEIIIPPGGATSSPWLQRFGEDLS